MNIMPKEVYTRKNFRSSLLRQVIIRCDYSSLTDLNGFIMKLKSLEWFQNLFAGYRLVRTNNFNLQINPKAIEDRFIPLEVNETGNIHRFFDCKIEPKQNSSMDISPTFICLTIGCNDSYDTIDAYLDSIADIITTLKEYDSYVQIERLAIRKIDGKDYDSLEEAYETFEVMEDLERNIIDNVKPIKKVYTDSFISNDANIKVNFTRGLERFNDGTIRCILDMDGYIDSSLVSPNKITNKQEIESLLKDKINDELFKLFRASVTENFLSKGLIS